MLTILAQNGAMVDADIRNRLEILKDSYDLISGDSRIRAGDRNTQGLRLIQSRLPWVQGPNGPTLNLDEPVTIGTITIAAGLYGPESLLRAIAASGPVVNGQSLRAVLETPMPGVSAVATAMPTVMVEVPSSAPMAVTAGTPSASASSFLKVLVQEHACVLHNARGGEQAFTPPNGFSSPPIPDMGAYVAAKSAAAAGTNRIH